MCGGVVGSAIFKYERALPAARLGTVCAALQVWNFLGSFQQYSKSQSWGWVGRSPRRIHGYRQWRLVFWVLYEHGRRESFWDYCRLRWSVEKLLRSVWNDPKRRKLGNELFWQNKNSQKASCPILRDPDWKKDFKYLQKISKIGAVQETKKYSYRVF